MVTGSSAAELDSIVHAHDLPGLAPLDHDLLRFREQAAAPYSAATVLPSGELLVSWDRMHVPACCLACLNSPPVAKLKTAGMGMLPAGTPDGAPRGSAIWCPALCWTLQPLVSWHTVV